MRRCLGELDIGVSVLDHGGALEVIGGDHGGADDLHGLGAGLVTASQVVVELRHGAAKSVRSEFLVHVHNVSAG